MVENKEIPFGKRRGLEMIRNGAFISNDSIHFTDPVPLENVYVNLRSVEQSVDLLTSSLIKRQTPAQMLHWTLKALRLTDLTTLSGDDTRANVERLCFRAAHPFPERHLVGAIEGSIHTAAVCVYPNRVRDAYESLKALGRESEIGIAAGKTREQVLCAKCRCGRCVDLCLQLQPAFRLVRIR